MIRTAIVLLVLCVTSVAQADEVSQLRQLAEKGNPLAQFKLGDRYKWGEGVPQDKLQAIRWYEKAAEHQHQKAIYRLANMYLYGDGIPQDKVLATQWIELAARTKKQKLLEQKSTASKSATHRKQSALSEPEREARIALAAKAMKEIVECGSQTVMSAGIRVRLPLCIEGIKQAAERGMPAAEYALGNQYYRGRGVRQDKKQAAKWFQLAAESRHWDAAERLATMFDRGEGVPQDNAQATKWHLLANKFKRNHWLQELDVSLTSAEQAFSSNDTFIAKRDLATASSLAESLGITSDRIDILSDKLAIYQSSQEKLVADDEFDSVISMFNGLKDAIETQDIQAMNQLTDVSEQNALFEQLFKRIEKLVIDIIGIRVLEEDKSIVATLRINYMVRKDGTQVTPSESYKDRIISSSRIDGRWGRIDW